MPHWFTVLMAAAAYLGLKSLPSTRLIPVRLIGVAYHEAGHWLLALLTGSRPAPVRFCCKTEDGRITYGEVMFTAGRYTAALVALSPLIFTPWAVTFAFALGPVFALAAAPLLAHGLPSSTDWRVALAHPLSWPLAALGLVLSTTLWYEIWLA